jgi:2-polyprenyl-6-hydroxyphenyl methylase / 3-demethylubiquinone-9 3-methyltransferase
MSSIDNTLYDRLGDAWWAPRGPMAGLQQLNPVRAAYFESVCASTLRPHGPRLAGLRILDVGCGGGFLAEALARAGADVSAVDRSVPTIEAARRHAASAKLAIDYRSTDALALPYTEGEFDAVVSSDFLEHVSDQLEPVLAEQTRVLRPGGLLGFETINRTLLARVVLIWLAQDLLRVVPRHLHDARLFVSPDTLAGTLGRLGLRVIDLQGIVPARGPLAFLWGYLTRRESGGFRLGRRTAVSYIGYALRS